jgi:putative heme-binding domain-containing protein
LAEPPSETAIPHALWLAAVPPTPKGRGLLITQAVPPERLPYWSQQDPEAAYWLPLYPRPPQGRFRWHALRVLARHPELQAPRELFIEALSDPDPRIQLVAVQALLERPGPLPEALLAGPAVSTDTFLRQAATLLLARQAGLEELRALRRANDPRLRLAATLAAGFRLTLPSPTEPLPHGLSLAYHSQNAMFAVPYVGETVDLKALGPVGSYTMAERWQALPHSQEQESLFAMLTGLLSDPSEPVRLQAAHFLELLHDARSESRVRQTRLDIQRSRLQRVSLVPVEAAWVLGPFDDAGAGLQASHEPDGAPVNLAAELIRPSPAPPSEAQAPARLRWTRLHAQPELDLQPFSAPDGGASCYVYLRCQSRQPQQALLSLEPMQPARAWLNGRELDHQPPLILHLEPGTNELLLRLAPRQDTAPVVVLVRAPAELVWDLPEHPPEESLSERLRSAAAASQAADLPAEFIDRDWSAEARQGNPAQGRRLFGRDGLGCVRCHAISPNQSSSGGPSLAGAARRFSVEHLVESVLLPSRQVAPLFRATTIQTVDGQVLSGLVVSEDANGIELLLPDATRRKLALSDVEHRETSALSPMPAGLVKTPEELRDLLAYLLSENPVPP